MNKLRPRSQVSKVQQMDRVQTSRIHVCTKQLLSNNNHCCQRGKLTIQATKFVCSTMRYYMQEWLKLGRSCLRNGTRTN